MDRVADALRVDAEVPAGIRRRAWGIRRGTAMLQEGAMGLRISTAGCGWRPLQRRPVLWSPSKFQRRGPVGDCD